MSKAVSEKEEAQFRRITVDGWIFEVKMVRAIKVEEYGEPYSAIANISFNGDNAYVEGLLTKSGQRFIKKDYNAIKKYFQQLGVKQVQFDRYKKQESIPYSHDMSEVGASKRMNSAVKIDKLQLVSVS